MPSGQFSVFLNFAILGPFPTIFRLSQNHWTFPNAALVFPCSPHVVRSTLLRIGLSDFAWVGSNWCEALFFGFSMSGGDLGLGGVKRACIFKV